MENLWRLLGHSSVAGQVLEILRAKSGASALIDGQPGCGKSWLAKSIGAAWEKEGGVAFVAEGDKSMNARDFYPFGTSPMHLKRAWNYLDDAIGVISRVTDFTLGTGGIVSTFSDKVMSRIDGSILDQVAFLKAYEADYLRALERQSRRKPVLLIADNIHWWDLASLEFLDLVVSGKLANKTSLKFLGDIRVLAIRTSPHVQEPIHKRYLNEEIYPRLKHRYSLASPTEDLTPKILEAFGVKDTFSEEEYLSIANACGNNLALLSRVANELKAERDIFPISSINGKRFLDQIVRDRIQTTLKSGTHVVEMLKCASILGIWFLKRDLACLQNKEAHEVFQDLKIAQQLGIVEINVETARFAHDVFKTYFFEELEASEIAVYARLAECLTQTKPSDYRLRAFANQRCGNFGTAASLVVMAILARVRDGLEYRDISGDKDLFDLISQNDLTDTLNALTKAWQLILNDSGDAACVEISEHSLKHDLPKQIRAEIDFTYATALLATRQRDRREKAIRLLQRWGGFEVEELELGMRLSLLQLYALALQGEKDPARDLMEKIELYVAENPTIDLGIKDSLYVMYRMADGLYPEEIALKYVSEAVKYFGPQDGDFPRRSVEYYRSLNNQGAILLSQGKHELAVQPLLEAKRVSVNFPEVLVRDGGFPANNLVISQFRSGRISASEALNRQLTTLEQQPDGLTAILMKNNAVGYALLSGEFHLASTMAEEMLQKVSGGDEIESFIEYLVKQSDILVDFHARKSPMCAEKWLEIKRIAEEIPYQSNKLFIERHVYLENALNEVHPGDVDSWDKYPQLKRPHHNIPSWVSIGRGILLTDIQYWRTS